MESDRLEIDSCEKGGIIVFTSLFLTGMIFLLALSVDGHFLIQSKLEENNITEYLGMAALTGFKKSSSIELEERILHAISMLETIGSKNKISGVDYSWDFGGSTPNCGNNICSGDQWSVMFGHWVYDDINSDIIPCDSEDPDVLDCINAVKFTLSFKKENLVSFFNKDSSQNNATYSSSSIAFVPLDNPRTIRIAKVNAKH